MGCSLLAYVLLVPALAYILPGAQLQYSANQFRGSRIIQVSSGVYNPGSGMEKNPDPGSEMNLPQFLGLKILIFFDADPGSGNACFLCALNC